VQKLKKDMITGSILAVFSVVYYFLSLDIRQTKLISISSAFIPQLCAICIFLLSVNLIIRGLHASVTSRGQKYKVTENEQIQREENRSRIIAAVKAFVVLTVGILTMGIVGFVYGMVFYLFVSFILFSKFEKKNWKAFAILAIVVPIFIYLVFTKVFYLRIPAGIFGIGGGIL